MARGVTNSDLILSLARPQRIREKQSSSLFLTVTHLSLSNSSKFLEMTSISFLSSYIFAPSQLKTSKLHLTHLGIRKTLIRSSLSTPLPILSFEGDKIGETLLSLKSAPPETARAVVHRAIVADQQNARRGTASTLTRSEVRGGGRKPYPQKKTGRARRGSQRTPLRPGGGVVFGPKPKDWSIKINRKEKQLALSTALVSAAVNSIVVEDFSDRFEKPRTKEFVSAMKRWGLDPKGKSMFLFSEEVADNVRLSGRNIGTLKLLTPRTLNLFDILNADKLVYTPAAVDYLNLMYGESSVRDEEEDEFEGQLLRDFVSFLLIPFRFDRKASLDVRFGNLSIEPRWSLC